MKPVWRGACTAGRNADGIKCVQVGWNLFPASGGTYRAARLVKELLERAGISSSVLTVHTYPHPADPLVECALSACALPIVGRYGWSQEVKRVLYDSLQSASFAVIHGLYHHPAVAAAQTCRLLGKPFILIPHGGLDPWVFTYRKVRKIVWLKRHQHALFGPPSTLLFTSELEREKASPWLCGASQHVLHWPVPAVQNADRHLAKQRLSVRLGIDPRQRVLLFCGRIHPVKRIVETVRAFLSVAPTQWTFLVVGPLHRGVDQREFLSLLMRSGGRVVHAGPMFGEDLADVYGMADALVLASHKENFGHVLAEAAAHGLPVLISDGVNLWPEIERVQAGRVIHDCSEDRMRHELKKFLSLAPDDLARLGANGRAWARTALSPEAIQMRMEEIVRGLFARRGDSKPDDGAPLAVANR